MKKCSKVFFFRSKYQVEGAGVNLLHGSDNQDQAENELRAFFQQDQTLALIKPEGFQFKGGDFVISCVMLIRIMRLT